MSQTRRLAAILAADVAGYSRLMEADEAGTARALGEHRTAADPLVAEHGGRIVRNLSPGFRSCCEKRLLKNIQRNSNPEGRR
jgi:adenylate cyclase